MDRMTEIKVESLLRMAATRDRHADKVEWATPGMSRLGQYAYLQSIEKMDRLRAEARKLRAEAAQIQRDSKNAQRK